MLAVVEQAPLELPEAFPVSLFCFSTGSFSTKQVTLFFADSFKS